MTTIMQQPFWRFSTADEIAFGVGVAARIGAEASRRGYRRALIVTDANLIRAGVVSPIEHSLHEAGIVTAIFSDCVPEPSAAAVNAAAEAARALQPDVIVAVGGGSNIDTAKVAAALHRHSGHVIDYFGEGKVPADITPLFALPTTAGTGSEVTAVAMIEDPRDGLKRAIASPHLRPRLALVDPLLTLTCPPRVTAESGMDALVHAVEAFTVMSYVALETLPQAQFNGKQPLTDLLAAEAIRLISAHLRTAVYQPRNLAAREGMHLAALLAGIAFDSAGLGSAHALQNVIGALTHTSHGLGTGLLLPYVMAYLIPAAPHLFAHIAAWLGEPTQGHSEIAAAQRSVEAVQRLKQDIGIPLRLREIGVQEAHLETIARQAATYQRLLRLSPRPLDAQALLHILREAF